MKIIRYNITELVNISSEENPIIERRKGASVVMGWNKANEELAKREAFNGEYTIEDDGKPETYQPSIQEQLDAQAAAIMELMGVVYNG